MKTTKIFSVRSSPDPAKICFSPEPVRSGPVRAHLCSVASMLAGIWTGVGFSNLKKFS